MVAVFFEGELEEYYSPTQRQCKGQETDGEDEGVDAKL